MSLKGWETLHCVCGGDTFIQAQELIWKDGSGLTPKPRGWTCTRCHEVADANSMITEIRKKHKEQEIDELRASL